MDGEIEPDQLESELDRADPPVIVDIRTPDVYRQAHIPDSVNVPLSQLTREVEAVADADHVVTVCPHGKASIKAARLISAYEGFDGRVESLAGGLTAWDGPIERDEAIAGEASASDTPDAPF